MSMQASSDTVELPADQGIGLVDVAQFLRRHLLRIAVWVVLAGMLAGGMAVLLRLMLPRATVARQAIRFTFDGADRGQYPNGMPFSPKDVLAAPVLDHAYQSMQLKSFLPPDDFAARLTIYQASREMEMLEMEYQQKLGNTKLLQPERDGLEREFKAKMDALKNKVFTISFDASGLPISAELCQRVVSKIPECWAAFAQTTRGVKSYDIPMVTVAGLLDDSKADFLDRAETLRSTSRRLLQSAQKLAALPGGNLVRDARGGSLSDLTEEISNNYRLGILPAYLNCLRVACGKDPERVRDVIGIRISNQERVQKLAKSKAEQLQTAFREYITLNSGSAVPVGSASAAAPGMTAGSAVGLGTQMPAIMSMSEGFFDRVIAQGIQSRDIEYRQQLNERQIEAANAVLEGQESLEFDLWVLEQLSGSTPDNAPSGEQAQAQATANWSRLKDFTMRVQEMHGLLSERNLNAAAQLYRSEDPVAVSSESIATTSRLGLGMFGICAVAFVLGVVSALSMDRARALERAA